MVCCWTKAVADEASGSTTHCTRLSGVTAFDAETVTSHIVSSAKIAGACQYFRRMKPPPSPTRTYERVYYLMRKEDIESGKLKAGAILLPFNFPLLTVNFFISVRPGHDIADDNAGQQRETPD